MSNLILPNTHGQQKGRLAAFLDFLVGQCQQQMPDGLTCALVVFKKETGEYVGYSTPKGDEGSRRKAIHAMERCIARLKKKKFTLDTNEVTEQ